MASRWTSSGPSANRNVRASAHAAAKPKSSDTPAAAVCLNRPVDHPQGHARHHYLDHRNFRSGGFVAQSIHPMGGVQNQQPCLIDFDPRIGDVGPNRSLFGQRFAECDARLDASAHGLQARSAWPMSRMQW